MNDPEPPMKGPSWPHPPKGVGKRKLTIIKELRLTGHYPAQEGSELQVEVEGGEPAFLKVTRMNEERVMLKPVNFKLAAPTPRGGTAVVILEMNENDSMQGQFRIIPGTMSSIILEPMAGKEEP